VRARSHTRPLHRLLRYKQLRIGGPGQWRDCELKAGQVHGQGLILQLGGCDCRNRAQELAGSNIAVSRGQLPDPAPGEYYWTDLTGLQVRSQDGQALGAVDHLLATGANDVLVVRGERERLIPFVAEEVVLEVDLAGNTIVVDWDPDF